MTDSKMAAVDTALGKPVSGDLPENALKVRRNLLVFGLISIFMALGEIKLNPTSSILGFTFTGISDALVRNALLLTIGYLLIHFIWYAFDSLLEWRIRITGTRLAFLTGARFGDEHCDYPDDPRQSSLYTWWLDNAKRIGSFTKTADEVSEHVKEWVERVDSFKQGGDSLNLANAMSSLSRVQGSLDQLKRQVETTENVISSLRIPCSLRRFDSWFALFLRSQNLRWLLIDIFTPVIIGGAAIYLLATKP